MANGVSNYVENHVLEWIFKQDQLPTPPTGIWVSLHGTDPGDTGANEISGGSYARASRAPDANTSTNTSWNALDTSGQAARCSNFATITFPTASANWFSGNPILYFCLWDASTAGNCLWSGTIAGGTGVTVLSGTTLTFAGGTPGALIITLD